MSNEVSRCTGHCCKDFTLPASPMYLKNEARKARLNKSRFSSDEILKIAEMVILRFQDWTSSQRERGVKKVRGSKRWENQPQYHYTCKHFDAATGNCANYENRPRMCSDYPYGRDCKYRGCTRRCSSVAATEELEKAPCPSPTV